MVAERVGQGVYLELQPNLDNIEWCYAESLFPVSRLKS